MRSILTLALPKTILALSVLVFAEQLYAQMGDPFSIRHAWVDRDGNRTLDLQAGAPPIVGENWIWTHSLSYREQTLALSYQQKDDHLKPSQLGYSTFFKKPWSENWALNMGGSIAQRGLTDLWDIRSDSTHGSLFFFFNRNPGPNWRWTYGLVVLDHTSRFPLLPAFSVDFETNDKAHTLRLAFPQISYTYSPRSDRLLGMGFRYEGMSFLIQEKNSWLGQLGDYLQQEKIVLAPFLRQEIVRYIWVDLQLGYTLWSQIRVLGEGFKETERLATQEGFYLSTGLSYSFR
jgi:hypothetical protein